MGWRGVKRVYVTHVCEDQQVLQPRPGARFARPACLAGRSSERWDFGEQVTCGELAFGGLGEGFHLHMQGVLLGGFKPGSVAEIPVVSTSGFRQQGHW